MCVHGGRHQKTITFCKASREALDETNSFLKKQIKCYYHCAYDVGHMSAGTHIPRNMCGGQRTTLGSQVSPSTIGSGERYQVTRLVQPSAFPPLSHLASPRRKLLCWGLVLRVPVCRTVRNNILPFQLPSMVLLCIYCYDYISVLFSVAEPVVW